MVTPNARPDRRIQFIGDSITCGYAAMEEEREREEGRERKERRRAKRRE